MTVCPYSDHLIFVKDNKVHRVSPEGDRGTVSLGHVVDLANKEFIRAFCASDHHVSFLLRDKINTPTLREGCANLSMQSSMVSKYAVAIERDGKDPINRGKPIMTSNFKSRAERDEQNSLRGETTN